MDWGWYVYIWLTVSAMVYEDVKKEGFGENPAWLVVLLSLFIGFVWWAVLPILLVDSFLRRGK